MCPKPINHSKYDSVSSLKNICIDYLICNIEIYTDILPLLPENVKDKILKRLTCLPLKFQNVKCLYRNLVHSKIKQIDLSCTYVDDELLSIISQCKNLTELTLTQTNMHGITSTGLSDVVSNFKNLLVLQAPNCSAITDIVTNIIVKTSPGLAGIDFSGCENITDLSTKEIAKLSNLTALKLSRTKVTTQGIIDISNGNSNTLLKELHIDLCNNVTYEAINSVCEKCTSLEVLIFNNCSRINGILNISNRYSKLGSSTSVILTAFERAFLSLNNRSIMHQY